MTLSTPLSFLFPLLNFFGLTFADTTDDGPDNGQPATPQHTGTEGDPPPPADGAGTEPAPEGDPNGEGEGADPEDDAEDVVRRNAAQKIGIQGQELRADDLAIVSLLTKSPALASTAIATLKESNPKQAERLARLLAKGDDDLGQRLKDADPAVRDALQQLSEQMQHVTQQTAEQLHAQQVRTYKEWRREAAPELDPKTAEGQQPQSKRLREAFREALNIFPVGVPLTERMLQDAFAVAKDRVRWQPTPVRNAVDAELARQALAGRAPAAPKGGKGAGTADQLPAVNPRIAAGFGRKTPEQLQKIAKAKKAAGWQQ